jgi:hypothetical protein
LDFLLRFHQPPQVRSVDLGSGAPPRSDLVSCYHRWLCSPGSISILVLRSRLRGLAFPVLDLFFIFLTVPSVRISLPHVVLLLIFLCSVVAPRFVLAREQPPRVHLSCTRVKSPLLRLN